MGLAHGYGVVIGTKADYFRDPPDDFGRFYHGNLIVQAPAGRYHCAIDVDPKNQPNGIQWRVVDLADEDFAATAARSDGWHDLASAPGGEALDYLRSPSLNPPTYPRSLKYGGWPARLLGLLGWQPRWHDGTGIQALTDLEAVLGRGVRFYVFGEPFDAGLGVHNIHQNQGDPLGSGFEHENAIWQDGGTVVQTAEGARFAFLNKFKTQAFVTDEQGHPR